MVPILWDEREEKKMSHSLSLPHYWTRYIKSLFYSYYSYIYDSYSTHFICTTPRHKFKINNCAEKQHEVLIFQRLNIFFNIIISYVSITAN